MVNEEKIIDYLKKNYRDEIIYPESTDDIPTEKQLVYILTYEEDPIVLGRGKKIRARVIFDDTKTITKPHKKALLVRLYWLYGDKTKFKRYILDTTDPAKVEKELHAKFGGNKNDIPQEFKNKLFDGVEEGSRLELILQQAFFSSYDGLADIRKWNRHKLLDKSLLSQIKTKLKLVDLK